MHRRCRWWLHERTVHVVAVFVTAVLIAGIASGTAFGQSRRPLFLNMGSTNTASGHYAYWVSVGQSITDGTSGRIHANVIETGAAIDNTRRLKRGEIEFGLITAEVAAQAYLGTGVFADDGPWEDIRMMWVYNASPNMFIVRADSGVQTLADLHDKPYNPGLTGSSTESIALAIFDTLGIQPRLHRGGTADAVNATKDGQIVGFTKSAGSVTVPDSSFVELNTFTDVRVVGLTEQEIAEVTARYPYFAPITVPPGIYPHQDIPYHTLAVVVAGVTSKDALSEDDVYDIMKAVWENKHLQDAAFPGVKDVDYTELTLSMSLTPLHAGAVKFFRDQGVTVPDHLIPPEAR